MAKIPESVLCRACYVQPVPFAHLLNAWQYLFQDQLRSRRNLIAFEQSESLLDLSCCPCTPFSAQSMGRAGQGHLDGSRDELGSSCSYHIELSISQERLGLCAGQGFFQKPAQYCDLLYVD